jgi:hypothetical protein
MRFANAAARDAALTVSIVKEGMVAYLQDTNVVQVNTDSTTTGWKQIYPVITAGITDAQVTNAKMAADSVSSANIIAATIVGGDIAASTITGSNIASETITSANILNRTIVGGDIAVSTITEGEIAVGTITGSNIASNTITSANILNRTIVGGDIATSTITEGEIAVGTITGSNIASNTITSANVAAGTYGISITGNAATADTAGTAGIAGDSNLLDGYNSSQGSGASTVAVRTGSGAINAVSFITDDTTNRQFYNSGTHTSIGDNTARVVNATTIYSQLVTSARDVIINSAGTLGTSTSSRRYKDDIQALTTSAETILQLEPVTFLYKPELIEAGQQRVREIGLIAEQAAELGLEQLVQRDAAGEPDAIAYSRLAVYLLKVCQTQQTQIDTLSARLDKIGA